jgi:FKBP-type peptidyl-prolyl cis-trans isomerase FkpA
MKKRLMFLALAAIGLAGCNGGFQKGDGGLLYRIVDDKSGPSIKAGDFVTLNFIEKNDADSLIASSYDNGQPVPLVMRKTQNKGDAISALSLLSEGDSAILKINIDSVSVKGQPRQAGLKGKYLVYNVKIEKVISKGNLSDQVFQGRCQAYMQTLGDNIKKAEPSKIKKYIADNNLKVTTTASGLNYVITTAGAGEKPAMGDTVVVNYIGKLLSGKIFDTSIKSEAQKAKMPINPMNPYKPIRFPLGTPGMIPGWNEGLQLLPKGSKATFILPSSLGYGAQGNGNAIPPFTPLVFNVELVDVIHPDPNAPKPKVMMGPQQPVQAQQRPVKK